MHSHGQFVDAEGRGTNAIEGLWSRAKRMLRRLDTRFPPREAYGGLLAEFLWREKRSPKTAKRKPHLGFQEVPAMGRDSRPERASLAGSLSPCSRGLGAGASFCELAALRCRA